MSFWGFGPSQAPPSPPPQTVVYAPNPLSHSGGFSDYAPSAPVAPKKEKKEKKSTAVEYKAPEVRTVYVRSKPNPKGKAVSARAQEKGEAVPQKKAPRKMPSIFKESGSPESHQSTAAAASPDHPEPHRPASAPESAAPKAEQATAAPESPKSPAPEAAEPHAEPSVNAAGDADPAPEEEKKEKESESSAPEEEKEE